MASQRLIVIGGDAAGMSAASQARRRRGPDDLEIVAFERGRHTSYSACGIPYLIGGVVADPDQLVARDPETFRSKYAIDVHLRHEAIAVDLERRAVRVADLEAGRERWEPFDELVVATGSVPVRPDLPGAEAEGVRGVQTLDDGVEFLRVLAEEEPRRAVVVGGGYIGLEMAEALVMRGLEVALVEAGPQPMGTLDPDMGALVADALRGVGVCLHTGSGPRDSRPTGAGSGPWSPPSAPSPPTWWCSASGCGPTPGWRRPPGSPSAPPPGGSSPTGACTRPSKGCGQPGTAWRASTWCPAGRW